MAYFTRFQLEKDFTTESGFPLNIWYSVLKVPISNMASELLKIMFQFCSSVSKYLLNENLIPWNSPWSKNQAEQALLQYYII